MLLSSLTRPVEGLLLAGFILLALSLWVVGAWVGTRQGWGARSRAVLLVLGVLVLGTLLAGLLLGRLAAVSD